MGCYVRRHKDKRQWTTIRSASKNAVGEHEIVRIFGNPPHIPEQQYLKEECPYGSPPDNAIAWTASSLHKPKLVGRLQSFVWLPDGVDSLYDPTQGRTERFESLLLIDDLSFIDLYWDRQNCRLSRAWAGTRTVELLPDGKTAKITSTHQIDSGCFERLYIPESDFEDVVYAFRLPNDIVVKRGKMLHPRTNEMRHFEEVWEEIDVKATSSFVSEHKMRSADFSWRKPEPGGTPTYRTSRVHIQINNIAAIVNVDWHNRLSVATYRAQSTRGPYLPTFIVGPAFTTHYKRPSKADRKQEYSVLL
ncbi:hypothetical protein PYCC9005_004809 [Savitreella phatthalungensis]